MEQFLVILAGLIGGVSVGLQAPISGAMGQRIGGTAASFVVHFGGLILSGLLLFLRGGEKIKDWPSLPWYMLGAGIFGVILYITMSITLPRLGGTMVITLIIIGQLTMGILVDHFGWFGVAVHPVSIGRVAGMLLLLLGGFLIARQ